MNHDILLGKTQEHLITDEKSGLYIHARMIDSLNSLRNEALKAGFQIEIASAFRAHDHQMRIWNAKAQGLRALYDSSGNLLDFNQLSKIDLLYSILRWSALPGGSRHHWGSDIDIFDKSKMPQDYDVQLTPEETEGDGYFAPMHEWLDTHLEKFGFFRPYAIDNGGIAPERWHISFAPVAIPYMNELTYEVLENSIKGQEISLKEEILSELPLIFKRFIKI